MIGLLSGIVTFLVGLLCCVLWLIFTEQGNIVLNGEGLPGQFDDEEADLEPETTALPQMTEMERYRYFQARGFIRAHPPLSEVTDISLSQYMNIQERGVWAWEFKNNSPHINNCFVEGKTDIYFLDGVTMIQANLPIPKHNDVYYFEVKMYDKPESSLISVGLTTKPYPAFSLPGYHRYSVAYDSTGQKRINQPFFGVPYGPQFYQGDVVGVGYRPRTGTVFFTRNGKRLEEAIHGLKCNLFPTIGANGECNVNVNFGQSGFVFIEANVKKWRFGPIQGSLAPPPPYGDENNTVLLEEGQDYANTCEASDIAVGTSNHILYPSRAPPPFEPALAINQTDLSQSTRENPASTNIFLPTYMSVNDNSENCGMS
ncbi:SPRY-domain-containing protein [Nadsonia fulvescens var. elongata DSM 6958]|uniref:SPRY-domain-containing protein n=1 Tax=Nadsonia fulvescens var. elongata DSM 6958 TaxID=857566 RepID=A0A1E3PGS6_9ASCO|nr:SPRY-domain-containing protein [Nadsonia fulvescens var. elongata DSM 6958]